MNAAHKRERPREETEARLLRERGTPEERIGPVVPDGSLYPEVASDAARREWKAWAVGFASGVLFACIVFVAIGWTS